MKFSAAVSVTLGLAGMATAAPLTARDGPKSAADIILEIAPTSATCDNTDECRTNVQVAPYMIAAASKYKLTNYPSIAAVLALTAFESTNYKFKTNQQGNAGQGTSNMQMYRYNFLYAKSIPELAGQLTSLGALETSGDTELQNKVRALVTPDEYNFGSGAWFMSTQCGDIISQLNANPDAGWVAYMGCVLGSPNSITQDRNDFWNRAKTAFGL
ncbi:hypothetical protein F4808DRAFT_111381 [Astrocystis sublimbata]|nr:hypothetical protein F4808DRAFT_111381 [Astrocystis sublimbata]